MCIPLESAWKFGEFMKVQIDMMMEQQGLTDQNGNISHFDQSNAVMYSKRWLGCEEKHLSVYLGCVMTGWHFPHFWDMWEKKGLFFLLTFFFFFLNWLLKVSVLIS